MKKISMDPLFTLRYNVTSVQLEKTLHFSMLYLSPSLDAPVSSQFPALRVFHDICLSRQFQHVIKLYLNGYSDKIDYMRKPEIIYSIATMKAQC